MLFLHIPQNSQLDRRNGDKSRKTSQRSSLLDAELTRAHQLLTEGRHFDNLGLENKTNAEDNSKVSCITFINKGNKLFEYFVPLIPNIFGL